MYVCYLNVNKKGFNIIDLALTSYQVLGNVNFVFMRKIVYFISKR